MVKTIGIVTSGGDAPGMNAAIRAVTRVGHSMGFQVIGFERGWDGLLTNCFKKLTPRDVGGIIQLGGTMLHTLRCPAFEQPDGVETGAETLRQNNVDGLVVIGGDGSFRGALDLGKLLDRFINLDLQIVDIRAHLLQERRSNPPTVLDQCRQNVFWFNGLIAVARSNLQRILNSLLGFDGKLVEIHRLSSLHQKGEVLPRLSRCFLFIRGRSLFVVDDFVVGVFDFLSLVSTRLLLLLLLRTRLTGTRAACLLTLGSFVHLG